MIDSRTTSNATINNDRSREPNVKEVDALNHILRGEVSAVEAYEQILEKMTKSPDKGCLEDFLKFHKEQVIYFTRKVSSKRFEPDLDSGIWGNIVKAFVGTAKLFGDNVTLSAIIEGEEHGLKEYRELLENEYVSTEVKELVRTDTIPKMELHINTFKALKNIH